MTSKLRAKKFRIPRPDVLEAVDASLGVTDGDSKLGSALAHAPQIPAPNTPAPNTPAPRIAAPQVPSLDEEVARPLEAPTGSTDIDEIRKEGLTGRQLRSVMICLPHLILMPCACCAKLGLIPSNGQTCSSWPQRAMAARGRRPNLAGPAGHNCRNDSALPRTYLR